MVKQINKNWDVIVIGAGPAGAASAHYIARAGFDVLLLDKDESPGQHNSCAGGMPYSLAQKLHLDENVIEKKITGCHLHFDSSSKRFNTGPLSFVTVYRSLFDNYLAEKAVSEGASLQLNVKVYDVQEKEEGLCVYINDRTSGNKDCLFSKIVIFADGVNTLAQRTFGIGFDKVPNKTCLAMSYDLESTDNNKDDLDVFCDSKLITGGWGYFWVFPKKECFNVGVGSICSKNTERLKKQLDYFIDKQPELRNKKKLKFSAGLIPLALAKRMSKRSCLVVGDAAGMVNPLTGAGLVFAIKSGEVAGAACVQKLKQKTLGLSLSTIYLLKLNLTRHLWWLRFLRILLCVYYSLSDILGKSLYPYVTKMYGMFFNCLPQRLIKNI